LNYVAVSSHNTGAGIPIYITTDSFLFRTRTINYSIGVGRIFKSCYFG